MRAWLVTFALAGLYAAGASPPARADSIYDVSIDTASLLGTGSMLAYDFIAGGGTQSNSVTISDLATDGTLISSLMSGAVNSGSVTDTLPGSATLTNASFFNEYQQGITLGSTLTFQLDATTNAPTGSSLPDTFSFFFLDPTATRSLLTTTDPTGSDSLFALQIDGSPGGNLGIYSSSPSISVTITAAPVPIPPGFGLLLSGLFGLGSISMVGRSKRLI